MVFTLHCGYVYVNRNLTSKKNEINIRRDIGSAWEMILCTDILGGVQDTALCLVRAEVCCWTDIMRYLCVTISHTGT